MTTFEELLQEAHENVRSDRKLLLDALESVRNAVSDADPTTQASLVKLSVEVAEGLTRSNSQLVELVKVGSKKSPAPADSISKDETEGLLDALHEEVHGKSASPS